jgi:hypothetical protein
MNEEQHIVGHQTPPREYFDGEEVDPGENGQVRLDKLPPGLVLAPFRRRLNTVSSQDC